MYDRKRKTDQVKVYCDVELTTEADMRLKTCFFIDSLRNCSTGIRCVWCFIAKAKFVGI